MSPQPITLERQQELVSRLSQLAARRATEGAGARGRDEARVDAARRQYQQLRDQAAADFERRHAEAAAEFAGAREAVLSQYEREGCRLAAEESRFAAKAAQELADSVADAKTLRQHRLKEVWTIYRGQNVKPKEEYAAFKQHCLGSAGEINALVVKTQGIVRRRCAWPEGIPQPPPAVGLSRQQYVERYTAAMSRAYERTVAIANQPAARFIEDGWPWLIFLAGLVVFGVLSWFFLNGLGWGAVVGAMVLSAAAVAVGIWQAMRPYARRQTERIVPEFQEAIAEARANLAAAIHAAKAAGEVAQKKLSKQRDDDFAAAKSEFKRYRNEQKDKHQARLAKAADDFAAKRKVVEDKFERQLDEIDLTHPAKIAQVEQEFQRRGEELLCELRRRRDESRRQRERDQQELMAEWNSALAEFEQAAGAMNELCGRHFAAWDSLSLASQDSGTQAQQAPPVVRFGVFTVSLPADGGGSELETQTLPAVLAYPECPSLLLDAEGEGRDVATKVLQNVMLRLLTTFPPGKVRFTIIDPVGLGQNFSAFMHLADYDEKLVNSRIWTEGAHIQQRLADLTAHMENVIQKYLRNEFASIQEYNEHAGEVAEPFQILVVANFPANFSDEAARRVAAIATSGAQCGVYTLISTDAKLSLPRNFDLTDLERSAATLVWDGEQRRFRWKQGELGELPLTLEMPPNDERFTQIVRKVGEQAKDAARVEVPFEMVTPASEAWWTADSRGGIDVPLGRAGAKNLQYLRLGKGTSQHVLISGKTGSGKSTLLNALITNLATHYSPEELEFYLIDFKKGVEFKAYAAQKLPHARVIAIESEREFGMSVLERLDQELKRRGDLFRKAGVQDLKNFRNGDPTAVMPRVLLIIDEFQEFFTSDDRIAHDAALLLDRLVRQGRAFGIHVMLGSQTLAGAYSLARSTLGQMAVRIALQCSETDAHLILSEDNTAARLLNRPGEAIYNDANGLFEGNHPFQVVWLSDSEREEYLQRIAELAATRQVEMPPPIVFEGNAAAELAENELLKKAVESGAKAAGPAAAWLGSAVAIKPPTEAVFRPQGGNNLLVVGQHDEMALGTLASSVISLAAQLGPIGGRASLIAPSAESTAKLKRFYILDGIRSDAPDADYWKRLAALEPFDAAIVDPRDAARVMGELAEEVNRRLASGEPGGEPVFVVIYNLARFRDLKKGDDYSFDDSGAGGGKQMTTVLREGPPVGVHTLVWCDSYNNVNRWLDRQAMRDFEMRVLFQMSAADSSNLMDSPAASRLGGHTAIFYSEERGEAEKFRPYGVAGRRYLEWAAGRFEERGRVGERARG